jgi:putative ABC transport system substrate-binding protein
MRRREFLRLLGSTAAAWPLAARAQQPERMRRIGVLMNTGADEPESQARLAAFMQGLQELGWAAGGNLRIDYRWSPGDLARPRKDAAELVALRPEVILAGVGATTLALQQATRAIPVVMGQAVDPVGNSYGSKPFAAGRQYHRLQVAQRGGSYDHARWGAPRARRSRNRAMGNDPSGRGP